MVKNKITQKKLDQNFLKLFNDYSLKKYTSKEISNKARVLLMKGANVDAVVEHGYTALHAVVRWKDPEKRLALVKMLIANGANVNMVNRSGASPIFGAASSLNKSSLAYCLMPEQI